MRYRDGKPIEALPIEKGVPIPPVDIPFEGTSPLMEAARGMEIGDSVVIPKDRKQPYTANMRRASGFKFTQRVEGDKLRIWRIA